MEVLIWMPYTAHFISANHSYIFMKSKLFKSNANLPKQVLSASLLNVYA